MWFGSVHKHEQVDRCTFHQLPSEERKRGVSHYIKCVFTALSGFENCWWKVVKEDVTVPSSHVFLQHTLSPMTAAQELLLWVSGISPSPKCGCEQPGWQAGKVSLKVGEAKNWQRWLKCETTNHWLTHSLLGDGILSKKMLRNVWSLVQRPQLSVM